MAVQIVSVLRDTFPATQFIVTTHSPHIIQNAEPNQIIALGQIVMDIHTSENFRVMSLVIQDGH